ncbi:hypothetical protein EDD18DRAFT_1334006 [Armillaria luteobubalina]|uniref:Uncharacterized protein n=1 Tax=Armillaria luteobubalina TaxID=153913 RepID=A0AA39PYG7_9AGAR|nr:hypothetical protein EDD18DRAFT_1334006 [Armillaria luteobubalina]
MSLPTQESKRPVQLDGTQESKRDRIEDAEEITSNVRQDSAPQAPSPQSAEVQAPPATSESTTGKKGRKLRLILMPFLIFRKRYSTLMNIKSVKDEEDDDTDQKPRGRVRGPVAGSGDPVPKPKPNPKPKPASGRWWN